MKNSNEGVNFLSLFSTSTNAFLLTDKHGYIVEANHAAEKLLGYTAVEITGRYIDSLIPDYYHDYLFRDRDRLHSLPQQRIIDQNQALTALCRDGSKVQIEIDLSILKPKDYPYVLVALKDPIQHLHHKHRLSESVESQRAMLEQAIVGFVQTDLQGRITQVNNCFCNIVEQTKEQLVGTDFLAITHFDDRHRHGELVEHLLRDNKPFTIEVRYPNKNGNPSWVNISCSRICDALRQPCGCVAVVMDVTERFLTAQALQSSEERLRLAEHAANLGIFDIDVQNNSIQCNDRILQIWGFSPEEALTCDKLIPGIHPEDQEARTIAFTESLDPNGTGEYQLEYRVIHKQTKHETWVSVTGRTFFENGQPQRTVGIVQDISRRKHTEDQRQQSGIAMRTLLKQQVASLTASAIAHELNQPLAAISAYSEVARRSLNGDSSNLEQLNRALCGCIEQAQRAGQTLHELLNFLQQNTIAVESLELITLIKETVATAQNDGCGGFPASLELQTGLPPALANRIQTQMVLLNLLRNGVEAMREAQITPTPITIKLQRHNESNMALITVQDSGPGLNSEITHRVFDPFFTTKSTGIGMGLAISRTLIQANGGQLWLDSNKGVGGVFHFTLPFAL